MRQFRSLRVAAVSTALLLCACGSSAKEGASTTTSGGLTGRITVLAGSSLKTSFQAFGEDFEAAHPGTTIEFSFGSSTDLEVSIEEGAPADVFASADQKNMMKLVGTGANAGTAVNFARNRLEIAVEPGNPEHITGLRDLTEPGLKVVLCAKTAPCGKFAAQVLKNAKIDLTPKSFEANAEATVSKVELGEADAALVYVTDVGSSGKVDGVRIPDAVNVLTTLPIVALEDSENATLAQAWVDYVVAHKAELVSTYGFLPL